MTVVVEFKEFGEPVQVLYGLADSADIGMWLCDQEETARFAAIDQVPWGPRPADSPSAVRDAGAALRAKLAALAKLQAALVGTFAGGANVPRPLYFRTGRAAAVESLPFEALWDEHIDGFACLARNWPIARIPADVSPPAGPFTMERAVRVAAVVAAEGIDPLSQIDAVLKGCAASGDLTVELTVFTTTEAAMERVRLAGCQARLVPPTSDELVRQLRELQPHLLHLFCHGTAEGPRLLVAQRDDLAVLELSAAHFAALAQPWFVAPWLVTLNCCEGAAPGEQTVSLASSLVRMGLPAVIGMRRAVDARMAHAFCADLYQAVLGRLGTIARAGRAAVPVEWAETLHEPRRRLVAEFGPDDTVAGRQKEWTMPVLYMASPRLRMRGRPAAGLDDATVKADLTTIAFADGLEANGNLPAEHAALMRDPALDRLYPGD